MKNPTDDMIKKYNEGKKYIEEYNNEKTKGILIRSKADWAECGEKNTKFFLNLEKRNYETKCITKLINEQEQEINKADEILEYEEKFYKDLYSQKPSEITPEQSEKVANEFKDAQTPKISNVDRLACEGSFTSTEIGAALKQLDNGKSRDLMDLPLISIKNVGLKLKM